MAAPPDGRMAAASARPAARISALRRLLMAALLFALLGATAARAPPPVSVLAVVFRGSGCRAPEDIHVRTKFDETGGLIRVGFSNPFLAASGAAGRTVRLACNGVIPLAIEPGKRIGITQVRIAGRVMMPSETSTALVTTEFFFPGERGPATKKRFVHQDGDQDFELLDPTGTVWSKCGGKQTFRVNAALLASGVDTEIIMVDGNGNGEGFQYEVIVKDCVANPRREL